MAAVTRHLEEIRGEKAPEVPYDPQRERVEQRRKTRAQTRRRGHDGPSERRPSAHGSPADGAQGGSQHQEGRHQERQNEQWRTGKRATAREEGLNT